MIYYSDEARSKALESIDDLVIKIGKIKGSELSYTDACSINSFFGILQREIMKESKEQAKIRQTK